LDISQEKNKLKKMEQGIPKISTPPRASFLNGYCQKIKKKLPMLYAMSHPRSMENLSMFWAM